MSNRLRWTWFCFLLFWLVPQLSQAGRWLPGDPVAAAHPTIWGKNKQSWKDIQLTSLRVDVDLRQTPLQKPASVSVLYKLKVSKPGKRTLMWVTPGLGQGSVRWQGKTLSLSPKSTRRLPKFWRYPYECKLMHDIQYMLDLSSCRSPQGRQVTLEFPKAGEYTLETRFSVHLHQQHDAPVYRQYIFAYLLSPLQLWAVPSQVQVRAKLPKKWVWSSNISLQTKGDWHVGVSQKLKKEHWMLSLSPNANITWQQHASPWIGMGLGIFLVFLLGWWRLKVVRGKAKPARLFINVTTSIIALLLPMLPFYYGMQWVASGLQEVHYSSIWKLGFETTRSFFLVICASSGLILCWLTGLIRWVSESVERDQARVTETPNP